MFYSDQIVSRTVTHITWEIEHDLSEPAALGGNMLESFFYQYLSCLVRYYEKDIRAGENCPI